VEETGTVVGGVKATKIKQSYTGTLDMGKLIASSGASPSQSGTPPSGTAEVSGTAVVFHSPTLTGAVKTDATMTIDATVAMPADAIAAGAPSEMKLLMDMKLSMWRLAPKAQSTSGGRR
jgi:hypothetical protein